MCVCVCLCVHRNDFERGATDIFEFTAPSVGKPMSKIRIGHDGSGVGSGWHLNKVSVCVLAYTCTSDIFVSSMTKLQLTSAAHGRKEVCVCVCVCRSS